MRATIPTQSTVLESDSATISGSPGTAASSWGACAASGGSTRELTDAAIRSLILPHHVEGAPVSRFGTPGCGPDHVYLSGSQSIGGSSLDRSALNGGTQMRVESLKEFTRVVGCGP